MTFEVTSETASEESQTREQSRSVYIVLSRSKSILSGAIHTLKRDRYTHAAIALDPGLEYMFSFGRRNPRNPFIGCFKRESLTDAFYAGYRTLPGTVLEIPVTREQHSAIISDLWLFLLDKHSYGFNVLGMLFNALGRQQKIRDNKFFCSEFVYHILHKNNVCDLGVPRSVIRPQKFLEIFPRIRFEGDLLEYVNAPAVQSSDSAYESFRGLSCVF